MRDFFKDPIVVFGICGFLALSSYIYKITFRGADVDRSVQSFNYEMPRPKAYYGEFDLTGRKVNRKVIRPESGQPAPATNADFRKAAEAKKDDKAKAQAKKDKDPKKKTQAQKKKSAVGVNVVDANDSNMKGDGIDADSSPYAGAGYGGDAAPNAENQQKVEDNKMSAAQWRSLLFAQPTMQNAASFITAFRKNEVDANSFYSISNDLLEDSAQDRQSAALYLLSADSSVTGFEILVAHHEKQSDPLKAKINAVLKTYSQPAKLTVLSRVLYHSDTTVVRTATDLLSIAVQAQQNSGQGNNRGNRGEGSTGTVAPSSWSAFIPALRRLAEQDDQSLAIVAQQLLTSIQALMQA